MNYSTFDRFQGVWLGSIIGLALGTKPDQGSYSEHRRILNLATNPWLTTRNNIAQIIIDTQNIPASAITQQLVWLVEQTVSQANANGNQHNSLAIAQKLSLRTILALLPVMIFQPQPQTIYGDLIGECNSFLDNPAEIERDILLWSYLLTSIINNQLLLADNQIGSLIEQTLIGVEVRVSCLVEQLEIIDRAWLQGFSLRQLTEELTRQSNFLAGEMRIRVLMLLALYCFASTPDNFMLSIKRASSLNYPWSEIIATLTATLSGAYNGITRLPINWRQTANNNGVYQQAQTTISALFKTWLGVYNSSHNHQVIYDPKTDAVAVPKIIQPRSTLKIISQKSKIS